MSSFDQLILQINELGNQLVHDYPKYKLSEILTNGLIPVMSTYELYEFIANTCATLISREPDFNKLAVEYEIKKIYLTANSNYLECVEKQNLAGLISAKYYEFVIKNIDKLNQIINSERDKLIDFFGLKTLERSYLLKDKSKNIIETPQFMFMRAAIQIHGLHLSTDPDDLFNLITSTYDLMSNLYFTHATPTLFNCGRKYPQLSSCYLLQCSDDLEGISKSISDVMKISKWAGGIGINLTDVRADGAIIKSNGGKSNGIIPLCKVLESVARYINQSGLRSGSVACYLETWHYDIYSFIELRRNTGDENLRARDLFLGLWISNAFMRAVESDGPWYLMTPDVCVNLTDSYGEQFDQLYYSYVQQGKYVKEIKARELFTKIIESQIETGMPYMLYKDHVNEKTNQKNLGTIKSSNLCVAPETKILTDKGYFEISSLKNKDVNVWNGEKFSNVKIIQTGKNKKLIRVNLSNHEYIDCTPYHKFHIYKTKCKSEIIEASKLEPGMKLIKFDLPTIDTNEIITSPYTSGLFTADGTYENNSEETRRCSYKSHYKKLCQRHLYLLDHETKDNCFLDEDDGNCIAKAYLRRPRIDLYGVKKDLAQYLDVREDLEIIKGVKRDTVRLNCDIAEKYYVPINCSIDIKLRWFAGLCDGDGCLSINDGNKSIQISSIHLDFLKNVRLMLTTLGVNPKIQIMHEKANRIMPDGKGGQKLFECQTCYRLLLSSNHLYKLNELGFKTNRLDNTCPKPQRDASAFITVESIEDLGRKDDTYCFDEPEKHMGIFNGIITGNCSEIVQKSSADEIAVCNLASICLPKFVENGKYNFEKLGEVVRTVVLNLNNIIDLNYYPVPETAKSNFAHRPIGLGVQGLADTYIKMGYPFDSAEASKLNLQIFECIYFNALTKSNELAKKYGYYSSFPGSPFSQGLLQFHLAGKTVDDMDKELAYDWTNLIESIKEFGTRNSLITTVMPTASTAQIMNNTESIEPVTTNLYVRKVLAGEYIVVNKYLVEDLKKIGLWNEQIYSELVYDNGSVQKLDIPEDLKSKYKTAYDIKQKIIVDQSVDRSRFIDQSQSLNLFWEQPDMAKVYSSHIYGWKKGLKTGMYYLKSRPATEAIKFGIDVEIEKNIRQKRGVKNNTHTVNNKQSIVEQVCESCSA